MSEIDTLSARSQYTVWANAPWQAFGNDSRRIVESRERAWQQASHTATPLHPSEVGLSLEAKLFDSRAACKIRTAQIAMHLEPGRRERFFAQVDSLLDADEWDEDDQPISAASFATLLRLLLLIRPKRWPGLGASMDGHVIAAWTKGENRLTVECLPEDQLRWVLVRYRNGERKSAADDTALLGLPDALQPYEPQIWFSE
ncbi:MAG TPA: hypothetical protein PLQ12_02490 [Candidatus Defluviicoccus seviourii]|nr:hypothetical protein [Candidatus Defluviicoccus seviourii]